MNRRLLEQAVTLKAPSAEVNECYRDITPVEIPTLLLKQLGVYTQNHQFASMCSMTIPTITAAVTVVTATDVLAPAG